ncbi:MAG: hypothetical protein RIB86_22575 [Imperialibacter sp.]
MNSQTKNANDESSEVKTVDDIPESRKIESIVYSNGIATDTIFYDELDLKIRIGYTTAIDSTIYITYSKYSLESPIKYDMSFYFHNHYISAIRGNSLPELTGELLDYDSIEFLGTALKLGPGCGHDDNIVVEEVTFMAPSESSFYIHAKKPECPDWMNHLILKCSGNNCELLFELQTSEDDQQFSMQNDSVITAKYSQLYDDGDYYEFDFAYDLKNLTTLVDTVYNRR